MSFENSQVPWREMERRLSGHPDLPGDGGDSPAWTRKRPAYEPPTLARRPARVRYAELHCHTNFSFLDGASHPEELAEEATRLGLEALAITDHNGFYGVVRAAEAARQLGLPTVFGSELTLGRTRAPIGEADPGAGTDESHLLVLARDERGYALLARAISEGQFAGSKGAPKLSVAQLARIGGAGAPAGDRDHWLVLTGCRKGAVPAALVNEGPDVAHRELRRLTDAFGTSNVVAELWDHGNPLDSARNDALVLLAEQVGVEVVATNNVHYATPARRPLAMALAAVRARRSLDEMEGWLPASAAAHLRSGAEQARRFARYPGVVERAADLGRACAFDLRLVAPNLPPFPCPDGLDEMGYLRALVEESGSHPRRYGPRSAERILGAWAQIDHELAVIDQLGFPGYFLIVWEIVEFCHKQDIYCQGRGSAANSAVCFALGITKADPVKHKLLFERFLSPERDGPPDIDIDIESDRREEVIQHVYEEYDRNHAAQVANGITYRGRSSVRDTAKAFGYAPGQQDAWAKQLDRWSTAKAATDHTIPDEVMTMASQIDGFPRHLGIHSGGMVLCDRPVIEVCPVEWATMADRSVLQWDKDDCAAAGLVKFDLLGLGMLSAIRYTIDLIATAHGIEVDLADIPDDDAVFDMLCQADTVGVFQVESRAQMATLPRLKPREFSDLVVEVALIRPGPIQGGSVHPYIRRKNEVEPVTYPHPLLKPSLKKTLGIPLFQEQLMQMAIDVAGFSPGEADQLRQAMGSKRSRERMEELRARFFSGMADRGITGAVADTIWVQVSSFATYGFPESHSISFAHLVYASAWLKLNYPAAFTAALLRAQPMGFYSPHSLVQDAVRHGIEVRRPNIDFSDAVPTLEWTDLVPPQAISDTKSPHPQPAVRLGLATVTGLSDDLAQRIVTERDTHGRYAGIEDLKRRVPTIKLPVLEALATAGALEAFTDNKGQKLDRRRALWAAGAAAQTSNERLAGIVTGTNAPTLPGMSPREMTTADLTTTGISIDGHPTLHVRADLTRQGVRTIVELAGIESGTKVSVGGVVTHRQRPATAGGITFVSLEDETGLLNVICSEGCWARYRRTLLDSPALLIRGRLQTHDGAINLIAERVEPLRISGSPASRDFR